MIHYFTTTIFEGVISSLLCKELHTMNYNKQQNLISASESNKLIWTKFCPRKPILNVFGWFKCPSLSLHFAVCVTPTERAGVQCCLGLTTIKSRCIGNMFTTVFGPKKGDVSNLGYYMTNKCLV